MHEKKIAKGVKTKEDIIMELHIDPQEPDLTFSGNRAFNTDCMEAMRQMPDKCFDLACVDPPYGIGAVNKYRGNSVIKADSKKHWDDAVPADEYFSELFRISRNQIIWGGNYFVLPPTRCILVWDKGETMYGRSFAELEMAWTSFDESARLFKYNPADPTRIHPTQKPVALYTWIFNRYAKSGDKILDTHLGSGSSRIAAYDMGLDFTGYEIDKDYFEAQEERFKTHTAQITLFDNGVTTNEYKQS